MKKAFLLILAVGFAASSLSKQDRPCPSSAYIVDILDEYFYLEKALFNGRLADAHYRAESIMAFSRNGNARKELSPEFRKQATDIRDAAAGNNIASAREHFKKLSQMLISYVERTGMTGYTEVYSPDMRANWLQEGKAIQNPYTGKSGPNCGQIVRAGTGKLSTTTSTQSLPPRR